MSLALVQAYSSDEEEEEEEVLQSSDAESDGGDGVTASLVQIQQSTTSSVSSTTDSLLSSSSSLLPSAAMVFSEVTGPPDYLKDSMGYLVSIQPPKTLARPQKDLPAGAIVESKPQLFELQERVRSDQTKEREESRSLRTAGMPPPDDAAKLLGVCLQCGVPKTYSAVKEGLVCPVCKDRQFSHNDADSKRRGSKIKDKERNKRVKGQSSHATWKSETEMHLRQQFD